MTKFEFSRIEELRTQGNTWKEVATILNDEWEQDYDESAYRKPYTAYKLGLVDSIVDKDIAEQHVKVEIEKKKLSMQRSAVGEMIRDIALRDLYQEQILDAIKLHMGTPKEIELNMSNKHDPKNYVVFLSDMHYDGNWCLGDMFGHLLTEIYREFQDVGFDKLTLVELGDTIEGSSLRPSQLRAIKTGMIDQITKVSAYYARFIDELHMEFGVPIDLHIVTSSNHTQIRPLNTKRNEIPDEDLMKVLANNLELYYREYDHIKIEAKPELLVPVGGGKMMYIAHGDKHGMTPNTVEKTAKEIAFYHQHGKEVQYYAFGHFHQYMERTLDRHDSINDTIVFLMPALAPTRDSYQRLGLMGCNPAFVILEFDDWGNLVNRRICKGIKFKEEQDD